MKNIFRKTLANITPYVQGKPVEAVRRELGLSRIEKLASNENQFGPSPKAIEAMRAELESVNFYPEGHPFALIEKLSKKLGVPSEHFVVASGGEAIIWNASMALLDAGDEIVTTPPSFDIYKLCASFLGAATVAVPVGEHGGFDEKAIVAAVTDRTKIVWLCSPNNPTGHIAGRAQIDYILANIPEHVVLVIDEAYYEFAAALPDYPADNLDRLKQHENLLILRTLSKVYGLAGVRIGYCVTSPAIAEKMNMVKLTFGVNRLAQVGALAALDDDEYLRDVVRRNRDAVDFLENCFKQRDLPYFPSYANFCWVDTKMDSRRVFEALQQRGVIIRPGFHWGWDSWIRVSTGTEEQMRFFETALDESLREVAEA